MTNFRIGLQGSSTQYTGTRAAGSRSSQRTGKGSFAQVLAQATQQQAADAGGVKFSKHAMQRLQDRNISLDDATMAKLNQVVERMSQKGSREALIYLNDVAMVVGIAQRTVVTAIDGKSAKENIFTNIDSAAILS